MSKHLPTMLALLKYVRFSPTFLANYNYGGVGRFEEGNVRLSYVLRCAFAVTATLAGVAWNVWESPAFEEISTYIKIFRSFIVVRCLMLSYVNKKDLAQNLNDVINVDRYLERDGIVMTYR